MSAPASPGARSSPSANGIGDRHEQHAALVRRLGQRFEVHDRAEEVRLLDYETGVLLVTASADVTTSTRSPAPRA